ncbi:ferrochelatase [Armatimonas rosea]|uniref:Ferrochelatase n=1 Tax=Armatimonas rosea TaxID=685828 RepID=A0A7W9SPX8_ARMRO|nr:ferrochelatase [Armatimonas rosea]MBB6050660.1 ferrochelatase [Armatimonas rosea]
MNHYDALLLLSFGGPEGPDDVLPFLQNVTAGRNIPAERLLEVAEHYHHFGGVSPINGQNRALIEALRESGFPLPIYFGNRNWHPFLTDTISLMKADGVERALVFVTSAFSSYSGCRQYREDIAKACEAVGPGAPTFDKLRVFYNHPEFVAVMAERVKEALAQLPDGSRVVFTAHSIPQGMARNCDYEVQLRDSASLIASACNLYRWDLAFQSRSGPPQVPWLEPDILDYLKSLPRSAGAGGAVPGVAVVPLGFVSDHMEVLYDLDYEAKNLAEELGLAFVRAGTAGTHPRMVRLIHTLVEERTSDSPIPLALGGRGPNHDVCPVNCCLRGEGRPPAPENSR